MNNRIKVITSSLLVVIFVMGWNTWQKSGQGEVVEKKIEFSKLVAFGDSDIDSGGAFEISKRVVESGNESAFIKPGELYWENRYSNGKTAVEVAAEIEGLELTNYAIGGAMSGTTNYTSWMDCFEDTGILAQVEKYKKSLNNEKPAHDILYFLSGGTNDYYRYMDYNEEGTLEDVAERVGANIEVAVRELALLGAEYIIVSEVKNLGVLPCEIIEGRSESAEVFTRLTNRIIQKKVSALRKELGLNIEMFEAAKLTEDMIKKPGKYGFKHHMEVIQPTWPEMLEPQIEEIETYMYFDEWHPSAAHHKVLGEALGKQIDQMER